MPAYEIPRSLLRLGAIAGIAAGILITVGFLLHPAGEDATFGTDPLWVPAHGVLWLAFVLALIGWIAVHVVQASRAGAIGVIAFAIVIVGTSLAFSAATSRSSPSSPPRRRHCSRRSSVEDTSSLGSPAC